jgi:uncharacterized protein (TIGR00730 family)
MKTISPESHPVHKITQANITQVRAAVEAERPGRKITVFGSNKGRLSPRFHEDAQTFGRLIGERGHNLVWGGDRWGVVGDVARAAKKAGSLLVDVELYDGPPADFSFHARTLIQRKAAMIALGDVSVALPGGIGTLGELTTNVEFLKGRYRLPPLVVLNTAGYYDGLRRQMNAMANEGFISMPLDQVVQFADTPIEAIQLAETVKAPPPPKQPPAAPARTQ